MLANTSSVRHYLRYKLKLYPEESTMFNPQRRPSGFATTTHWMATKKPNIKLFSEEEIVVPSPLDVMCYKETSPCTTKET